MTAPIAIDVSNNNGLDIDWHAVRGTGVRIAIAKCCEGDGGTHPGFAANWHAISAAQFERRGTYHFARAEHAPQLNAAAAMRAITEAGGLTGSDFVALDVEAPSPEIAWPLAAGAPTIDWTLACLAELERLTGRRPWLYCSQGGLGHMPTGANFNGKVIGLAPTLDGSGYWLMTEVGSIYAFGNATYLGDPAP